MPSITILSSIVSRVVPGISDTMALYSIRRAFNNVDLPEFGFPTIATGMPFFSALPSRNDCASLSASSFTLIIIVFSFSLSANSTSSSPKSSSSYIREAKLSNSNLNLLISAEKPPLIWFKAILWEELVFDAIISATASAWERSILPLKNALRVNPPGLAEIAPMEINSSKIFLII